MNTEKTRSSPAAESSAEEAMISADDVSFSYNLGETDTLRNITLRIPENRVTAFVGPPGSGKSTLLRCFNRMNDTIPTALITRGVIKVMGEDIYHPKIDPNLVRREVGMVFQNSEPLPKSIYDNVAFGLRLARERNKKVIDQAVEESLTGVALWDEVKDRLKESALELSSGQQQRLCIARTIAIKPKVILMDEPCSALDQAATGAIEELIKKLRDDYTVVIVTHNMQQATRISDQTAFLNSGELIEYDLTSKLFTNPSNPKTEAYISGRFG